MSMVQELSVEDVQRPLLLAVQETARLIRMHEQRADENAHWLFLGVGFEAYVSALAQTLLLAVDLLGHTRRSLLAAQFLHDGFAKLTDVDSETEYGTIAKFLADRIIEDRYGNAD